MSRYYKATEVDEFLNIVGKGNCNLCAFYDDCNSRGLNRKGSHRYCWQVKRFPTVDVVEVVRCKECKSGICVNNRYMCKRNAIYDNISKEFHGLCAVEEDHFCSYGERKCEK